MPSFGPSELLSLELSEPEVARGAAAICDALQHARERRRVHLGVSPEASRESSRVARRGQARVLFGIEDAGV